MGKRTQRQKELKRDYMRLYRKLDKYGQAPKEPLLHPWQRDIRRLEARWQTVSTYASIYNRFKKSVEAYNTKYYQHYVLPEAHTAINTQTLLTMSNMYSDFKKVKKSFTEKLRRRNKEAEIILKNLLALVAPAQQYSERVSAREALITLRIKKYHDKIIELSQRGIMADAEWVRKIRTVWDSLVEAVNHFIYDSGNVQTSNEAWAKVVFLLTGDGARETEIIDDSFYDVVYE